MYVIFYNKEFELKEESLKEEFEKVGFDSELIKCIIIGEDSIENNKTYEKYIKNDGEYNCIYFTNQFSTSSFENEFKNSNVYFPYNIGIKYLLRFPEKMFDGNNKNYNPRSLINTYDNYYYYLACNFLSKKIISIEKFKFEHIKKISIKADRYFHNNSQLEKIFNMLDNNEKNIYNKFIKTAEKSESKYIVFLVAMISNLYEKIDDIIYNSNNKNKDCKHELRDILFKWINAINDKLSEDYIILISDLKKKYEEFLERNRDEIYSDSVEILSIKCIENCIDLLQLLKDEKEEYECDVSINEIKFKFNIENIKLIEKVIYLISNTFENQMFFFKYEFFDYNNKPVIMSSGEEEILCMFSRIYKAVENITTINDREKVYNEKEQKKLETVILFLDEPDIYLHPEWKRIFLSSFFKYIENIFRGVNVQIIITSNSPILAGDVPRRDIIKLESGNIEEYKEDEQDTFARNLLALFKETFGMESLIGEFSTSKIKTIIEQLKNKNLNEENLSDAQKIINTIGEPVIKRKIQKLFYEYHNNGVNETEYKIIRNAAVKGYTSKQISELTGIDECKINSVKDSNLD